MDAELKEKALFQITSGKIQLLRKQPWLGRLALRLQPVITTRVKTTATDGVHIFANPEYVAQWTTNDARFEIAHEVYHVVYKTIERGRAKHYIHNIYNMASDIIIDSTLFKSGLTRSRISIEEISDEVLEKYDEWTSEEVYFDLLKNSNCPACKANIPMPPMLQLKPSDDGDQSGSGDSQSDKGSQGDSQSDKGSQGDSQSNGSGQPKHTCGGIRDCCAASMLEEKFTPAKAAEWKQAIVNAVMSEKNQGNLPGNIIKFIDSLTKPSVSWKHILRRSATKSFRNRYSWKRPSRRDSLLGTRLMAKESSNKGAVLIIDTSGSISKIELTQFVTESSQILREIGAPEIEVYLHNVECYKVFTLTRTNYRGMEIISGGTSHIPVFKKVLEDNPNPGMIIAFTDLYTTFPEQKPPCTVVWAHPKSDGTPEVPWGIKIAVDLNEGKS